MCVSITSAGGEADATAATIMDTTLSPTTTITTITTNTTNATLGKDDLLANTESMIPSHAGDAPLPPQPLLIMFNYHTSAEEEVVKREVKKELVVTTIRTSQVKKTSGDFVIEPLATSNPFSKCFIFEPLKVRQSHDWDYYSHMIMHIVT